MSRATKRKHVMKEVLDSDFELPVENQEIVKILASRGNNLHEVQSSDGSTFLVSMPVKFRKNVWVKRGDFVLVEPISEGDKVKAEMVRILTSEQIKYFKKSNCWPFALESDQANDNSEESDIFVNTNRPTAMVSSSSEESESDVSESSDELEENSK